MELDKFIKNFANQFEESEVININADVDFKSLDTWDSLTAMSVQLMIEDEYNIQVTLDEFKNLKTVSNLYDLVIKKSKK